MKTKVNQSVLMTNVIKRNYFLLLFAIFTSISSLQAWNKVWETTGTNNDGTCRSPVICRNLTNDGIVTASYWFCNNLTSFNKYQLKFLETDDNGNAQNNSEHYFEYGNSSPVAFNNYVQRFEMHRIIPDVDNDRYLLLATAHNPNNVNLVSSYIIELDNSLTFVSVHLLSGYYQYWDMAIAPLSGDIVTCGFNNSNLGLTCTTRVAVVMVMNSTFTAQNTYEFPASLPLAGNIPRFDNAKCIKIWDDGVDEFVAVAGNLTAEINRMPGLEYYPKVFMARFALSSGALTQTWMKQLDASITEQMIPADILVDQNQELITTVGSSSKDLNAEEARIWQVDFSGIGILEGAWEGAGINFPYTFKVHNIRPYSIALLNNGNYRITGWAENYYFSTTLLDKYNFFSVDFDPVNQTFNDINVYLGNTSNYYGIFGNGFYAVDAQLSYTYNSATCYLASYHTPQFHLTWFDGSNQQSAWSWVNIPNPSVNLNRHELRIKSTISGVGDGSNCDAFISETSIGLNTNPNTSNPGNWSSVDNQAIGVPRRSTHSKEMTGNACNGFYN